MKSHFLRLLAGTASALLALHAVLLFGLIGVNEILWMAAGMLVFFTLLRPGSSFLLSGSLLAAALAASLFVGLTGIDEPLYYKPTTRLLSYDFEHGYQIFRPNSSVRMTEPFGALRAMTARDLAAQEKQVLFETDSRGFRNDADYSGQPWVLLGDSFIVCTSVTQKDMLSRVLEREYGMPAYNVAAVGGDLGDYLHWYEDFRADVGESHRVLLFFFEGNDFLDVVPEDEGGLWDFIERYRDLYRYMPLGKYAYTQLNRLTAGKGEDPVKAAEVSGRQMLFYEKYMEVCRRSSYEGGEYFQAFLSDIARAVRAVYFIPAKYRVYHGMLPGDGEPLPHAQWEYLAGLCAEIGLPCHDLTPALISRSRALARGGEYTYYLDDTHWNAKGIEAAAQVVADSLTGASGGEEGSEAEKQ
jgi:hypothetical protein